MRRAPRLLLRAAAVALAALLLPVSPAVPAAAETSVTIDGRGWGHGRGMGQWGAYGYAVDYGWTSARILNHYYGGTSAGTVPDDVIGVRLVGRDGDETVTLTSDADYYVDRLFIGAGSAVRFTRAGGSWRLTAHQGGCAAPASDPGYDPPGFEAPSFDVRLASSAGDDPARMLKVCDNGRTYRGGFRLLVDGGVGRLVNQVRLEQYLRGVVPYESPASWGDAGPRRVASDRYSTYGMAALEAQAVAARSYASAERRSSYAQTCDTISCQVYNGVDGEDHRTDAAVARTAGVVRKTSSGAVARTEFSSSTGGWTAGGTFTAVEDLGDTRSPRHTWTTTVSGSAISRAYPAIGTFARLDVTRRNGLGADGGRVLELVVVGSDGRVTTSGNDFRSRLGLYSDWFTPRVPATRIDWLLRSTATPGDAGSVLSYGGGTDVPVVCDVDGNAADDVAVYRDGRWLMRDSATPGAPQRDFSYGAPGWLPVCGDWDGDGKDGIGVYDGGRWFLRNAAAPGPADVVVDYGWRGAVPVPGDWDGNGTDTLGVYAAGRWLLRNSNTPGRPVVDVPYGWSGAVPVPGDNDGNGTDTLGVYSRGQWLLRDRNTAGDPSRSFAYGAGDDAPVRGDWVPADRRTGIGVTRLG